MKLVTAFLDLDYWISLDEAAEFLGVDIPARHRVLGDVLATIELVKRLKIAGVSRNPAQ